MILDEVIEQIKNATDIGLEELNENKYTDGTKLIATLSLCLCTSTALQILLYHQDDETLVYWRDLAADNFRMDLTRVLRAYCEENDLADPFCGSDHNKSVVNEILQEMNK